MRVLSGIQPTGRPHWGNWFGAVKQYIALQNEDEAYYFVANLHALTTIRDGETLYQNALDTTMDMLALGLDPDKAILFLQSDVPEVSELCWILLSGTPMGVLERCVSYKDKIAKGLPVVTGLFTYPVLQAADILAYDSNIVPVGEDQKQHIELCRDIANAFNHQYGEVFVVPEPHILDHSAKVPGTDGEKMSKSYDNFIEVFEPLPAMKKKIMRITMDSRPMEDPKDPETCHLFDLFSLFADESQIEEMAATYRKGGFGYGDVKKKLLEGATNYFAEARERRTELESDPDRIRDILNEGAKKARAKASEVLRRAQDACGLKPPKK